MTRSQMKLAILLSCLFSFLGTFAWNALRSESQAARNSAGTYSLPSGNPVVTGTTIASPWANSTLSDVGTELTNSLDRGGRGAMTAPLRLANGSSSAPALAFASETNSGLYRAGSNDIRAVVATALVQKWTATGTTIQAGTTGAGATVLGGPSAGIGVLATGNALSVSSTTTSHGVVGVAGADGGVGLMGLGAGTSSIPAVSSLGVGLTAQNPGVVGVGGTAGPGVAGFGTASGPGGYFEGGGGGYGAIARGATSSAAAGALLYSGTDATATVSQDALAAMNGAIVFNGANPNSDVGFANRVTPKNIIKAWGDITAGNSPAINDGFNFASMTCASNAVTINFVTAMASGNYAVAATSGNLGFVVSADTKGTTSFKLHAFDANTATTINLCSATRPITFQVVGAQ